MRSFLNNLKGDKVIWMVVFILSVFSILAVYSSTGTLAYRNKGGNTEFYLIKHLSIMLMGLALMYFSHLIRYTYYSRISQIAMIIALPLLLLTLVTGTSINEANRWLTLPVININFQTSDLAKLALIIYVARMLSKKQEQIKDFKTAFVPVMLPILITCMLIFPANLSTAVILFATSIILMFIGRVSLKYIGALVGIMILISGIFILILFNSPNKGRLGTWKNRIENFFSKDNNRNSDEDYQITQAKIAVATGKIFGKMPGHSSQRNFLPQAYSDFIYAIIIEEYGLIGGIIIMLLYLILLYRSIRIATKTDKIFGALLCIGISFTLVFQAMINMAIVVDLFPVTGQPLPMLSMGGTSLWFTSIGIGIILSISRDFEKEQKEIQNLKEEAEHA